MKQNIPQSMPSRHELVPGKSTFSDIASPLASFVVCAYNQESFIKDAVEGAFAQTYSPLEIILSDDHSSDSTFEIMERMAAEYSGPHQIRLNRNTVNMGVTGHVNKLFEMASGDIIIGAAGDDISVAERAERLMREFLEPAVCAVSSNLHIMSSDGQILSQSKELRIRSMLDGANRAEHLLSIINGKGTWLQGAGAAYRKKVLHKHGPLPNDVYAEDVLLSFCALLEGELRVIDAPLVKYRQHDGSIMHLQNKKRGAHNRIAAETRRARARLGALQFFNDRLKSNPHCLTPSEFENCVALIRQGEAETSARLGWLDLSFISKCITTVMSFCMGKHSEFSWRKRVIMQLLGLS